MCFIQSYSGHYYSVFLASRLMKRRKKESGDRQTYLCFFVHNKPPSQSSINLEPFRTPPLPCFNFPPIIMFPFALFTLHLRFLFNWKLVWIWIRRKYLLNKCASELITCQDSQATGERGNHCLFITWLCAPVFHWMPDWSGWEDERGGKRST